MADSPLSNPYANERRVSPLVVVLAASGVIGLIVFAIMNWR